MGEVVKFPPPHPTSYVSPYLLRPLRRVEEVEQARRRRKAQEDQAQPEASPKTPPRQDAPAQAGD